MRRSEIEGLLPGVFQRTIRPGSPLAGILEAMAALHAPDEAVLADLPSFLSPYRTPDEFVAYLASWVDLGRLLAGSPEEMDAATFPAPPIASGLGRLRELIAAAAELSRWRGTARGLVLFLETATGVAGFEVDEHVTDEQGQQRPFHIRVRVPEEAMPYRRLIGEIVEMEKPAYATWEMGEGV